MAAVAAAAVAAAAMEVVVERVEEEAVEWKEEEQTRRPVAKGEGMAGGQASSRRQTAACGSEVPVASHHCTTICATASLNGVRGTEFASSAASHRQV